MGERGENLAVDYLSKIGYEILHRNVRCQSDEIDVIARDGDELVFAEVRTRMLGVLSPPHTTVGARKLRKLTRAAYAWVDGARWNGFWSIDLVAITVMPSGDNKIEHFKTITEAIN